MRNIWNGSGAILCPSLECLARRYTLNINTFEGDVLQLDLRYAFDAENAAEDELNRRAYEALDVSHFDWDPPQDSAEEQY
jgi:hypothetical protein